MIEYCMHVPLCYVKDLYYDSVYFIATDIPTESDYVSHSLGPLKLASILLKSIIAHG